MCRAAERKLPPGTYKETQSKCGECFNSTGGVNTGRLCPGLGRRGSQHEEMAAGQGGSVADRAGAGQRVPHCRKRKGAWRLGSQRNDRAEATGAGGATRGTDAMRGFPPVPTGEGSHEGDVDGPAHLASARFTESTFCTITGLRTPHGEVSQHHLSDSICPLRSLCHALVILAAFRTSISTVFATISDQCSQATTGTALGTTAAPM